MPVKSIPQNILNIDNNMRANDGIQDYGQSNTYNQEEEEEEVYEAVVEGADDGINIQIKNKKLFPTMNNN